MTLAWQYVLIFFGVAIEGPAVTLAAAALAGTGVLDPYVVFLSASMGNVTGDLCWYLLGYLGRVETLIRWFPSLASLRPQIERLKTEVAQHASRMLFIAKLAFGVASIPTLVAAGIARVSWLRVVVTQVLGEVVWTGSLVLFGLFLGQYVAQLQKDLRIGALVTALLFISIIIWLIRRHIKSQS
ncbi:MAG: VTT domain-containing protein [Caldilineaceae bacterium]